MSDAPQGPGWWQASDLRWYPPDQQPGPPPQPPAYPMPGGVPYYGYATYPPPNPTNGKAIASMVLGIASLAVCYIGWIAGIVAIVLGRQARKEIEATGGMQPGWGMTTAGIVTAIVSLALHAIVLLMFVSFNFVGSSVD